MTENHIANYHFLTGSLFSDMELFLWFVLCLIVECCKSKHCFDEDIQSFESTIFDLNNENNFDVFDGIFGLFYVCFSTKAVHRHCSEILVNSYASLFLLNISIISPVCILLYHKIVCHCTRNFWKEKQKISTCANLWGECFFSTS